MNPASGIRVGILVDEYLAWLVSGRQPTGIPRFTQGILEARIAGATVEVVPVVSIVDALATSTVTLAEVAEGTLNAAAADAHGSPLRGILHAGRGSVARLPLPRSMRNSIRTVYLRLAVHSFATGAGARDLASNLAALIVPSWNAAPPERIQRLAASGVAVRLVVHDLFPITNPGWFPRQFGLTFHETMDAIVPWCERFVVLTPQVARTLERVYPTSRGRIRVGTPTLAVGRVRTRPAARPLPPAIRSEYILALSTVEPRKNLATVLEAWRIAKREPRLADTQLVVAGQRGWLSADVESEIRRDAPHFDIVRLPRVDDDLADALYGRCLATVHASWAEGYGTPVRESIARGIWTIVSSAIPSDGLPEGAYSVFNPASPSELAVLIVEAAAAGKGRRPVQLGAGNGWEPVLQPLVAP